MSQEISFHLDAVPDGLETGMPQFIQNKLGILYSIFEKQNAKWNFHEEYSLYLFFIE